MKVTIVNQKKKNKQRSLIYSIILLVLGIFLTFNSSGVLNTIFNIMGILVILFGIYRFFVYYRLKSQLKVDDSSILMSAIMSILFGVLIILLSNILTTTIQIVTGIWLLFVGISRLSEADITNIKDKRNLIAVIGAAIIILLGLYTIFSENVLFVALGIILIIYSILDIINYIRFAK
ncbi:TPA: DUF308 domain-containing protein [Candidatus Ventrenecus avicola]|nr:DUF308 domain-containing protein [Candidatus Ventrenecus avicola]